MFWDYSTAVELLELCGEESISQIALRRVSEEQGVAEDVLLERMREYYVKMRESERV